MDSKRRKWGRCGPTRNHAVGVTAVSGPVRPDPYRPAGAGAPGRLRAYGVRDLVELAIAHGGLGSYTQERYDTLRRALGAKTDLVVRGGGREAQDLTTRVEFGDRVETVRAGAPGVASTAVGRARAIRARARMSSPFADYLEAPPDVHELWRRHQGAIQERLAELNRAEQRLVEDMIGLAIAALLRVEPELEHKRIPESTLESMGWPHAPPSPAFDEYERS